MNNGDRPVTPLTTPDVGYLGLTKREHFAAMAMQGLLANGEDVRYVNGLSKQQKKDFDWSCEDHISLIAVSYANGLLKALEETK